MKKYIKDLKENMKVTKILQIFVIVYLPIFSFGIFGPTEIFFANHKDFGVIFDEFGWIFLKTGTLIAIMITGIVLFLPRILQKFFLIILWLFSICGYIQTMFLNKGLDRIGATLDGYVPDAEVIIKNFCAWLFIIIVGIVAIWKSKEKFKELLFSVSMILFLMQAVAYGTLFISAPEDSMKYVASEYYLTGKEQYTVSSSGNVIVFILDTLSNTHYTLAEVQYPELSDILNDFTYYNNTDCCYLGTFPSVPHILTGNELDPFKKVNDWLNETWTKEETVRYYESLHEAGYKVNAFLTEPTLLSGSESLSLVKGKIDNLTEQSQELIVNHELLYQTLLEMSCYRFMPNYFKPFFDVPNALYASIATYSDNAIKYANPDFYAGLLEKGLTVTDGEKYIIYQHLNGIHELINDENCERIPEGDNLEKTVKGIWVLLEEYLNQLMDLGVYDNSTIIITADHGTYAAPQSIFFIKHANEHHDRMQVSSAPISLDELAPTIAEITTGEHEYLGKTIYDFKENEVRERKLYNGSHNYSYPAVVRYDGRQVDGNNVYEVYTYTGNKVDLSNWYESGSFETIPAADSYY